MANISYRHIDYKTVDRTAVVTIERPDRRNAVDRETAQELAAAFARFDADDMADVAILTGAGGQFCAGADLKAMADGDRGDLAKDGLLEDDIGPMGPTRMRLSKPVIAAIEGYAVAGGLELALWCDLRIAGADAIFGIFCRRFGVPLVDLGTVRLPRLIGHSRAMDLILTGRPVSADEALSIGLANRIAPKGQALAEALALAKQISAFPQSCLRHDRLSALEQWDLSEPDAMRNELGHGRATLASGESLAGTTRFTHGAGRHGA